VIKTLDVSSIFAADQECNFIDGLDYDSSTGTLWVSPDIGCAFAFSSDACSIGFVYNIDTSGNLLKRLQLPFGVAGVNNFYMVSCPTTGATHRPIIKTTLDGTVISTFFTVNVSGQHESAEDLAFEEHLIGCPAVVEGSSLQAPSKVRITLIQRWWRS
jgi:hypothetical protein